MNKLIMFFFLIGLASCGEDYTCSCVYQQQEIHSETFTNVSLQKARNSCNALMTTYQITKPGTVCIVPN